MRIRYDPEADAMYIKFRQEKVDHTKEIDENTIVDFNKKGQVIGVEVLFVKERNPHFLKDFRVENIVPVG
ncbi:DUF2283 domain-containing protein [Candidatus Woesearchaeota archaeon]|nr:DUF2283 domain-containing protein [Candidatus Woesearchaeota archaeon]